MIFSSYELARISGTYLWKKISVKIGIPICINISLILITITNSLFSFNKSVLELIYIRIATGFFNNLPVFTKYYILEIFENKDHPRVIKMLLFLQNFSAILAFLTAYLINISELNKLLITFPNLNKYFSVGFIIAFINILTLLFNLRKMRCRVTIPTRRTFFEQYEQSMVITPRKQNLSQASGKIFSLDINKMNQPLKNPNKSQSNVIEEEFSNCNKDVNEKCKTDGVDNFKVENKKQFNSDDRDMRDSRDFRELKDISRDMGAYKLDGKFVDKFVDKPSEIETEMNNYQNYQNCCSKSPNDKDKIIYIYNSNGNNHNNSDKKIAKQISIISSNSNNEINNKNIDRTRNLPPHTIGDDSVKDDNDNEKSNKFSIDHIRQIGQITDNRKKANFTHEHEKFSNEKDSPRRNDNDNRFITKKSTAELLKSARLSLITLSESRVNCSIIKISSIFTILQICDIILNNIFLLTLLLNTKFSMFEISSYLAALHFAYTIITFVFYSDKINDRNIRNFKVYSFISILFTIVLIVYLYYISDYDDLSMIILAGLTLFRNVSLTKVLSNYNIAVFNLPNPKIKDKINTHKSYISMILRSVFSLVTCIVFTYFTAKNMFMLLALGFVQVLLLCVNLVLIGSISDEASAN